MCHFRRGHFLFGARYYTETWLLLSCACCQLSCWNFLLSCRYFVLLTDTLQSSQIYQANIYFLISRSSPPFFFPFSQLTHRRAVFFCETQCVALSISYCVIVSRSSGLVRSTLNLVRLPIFIKYRRSMFSSALYYPKMLHDFITLCTKIPLSLLAIMCMKMRSACEAAQLTLSPVPATQNRNNVMLLKFDLVWQHYYHRHTMGKKSIKPDSAYFFTA